MRILRWRLKLAEYDYEVVYKAGKTSVNVLSRNFVDFLETDCNIIKNRPLNLNNSNKHPEDAGQVSRTLKESDNEEENEEDDDFHLYLSDSELDESFHDDTDVSPLSKENESLPTKRILKSDPPKRDRIQTRSQTANQNNEQNKNLKEGIDPPDKDHKEEEENKKEINRNLKTRKAKSIENNSNIVETRELLFSKNNVMYFVDTNGNSLDSGS